MTIEAVLFDFGGVILSSPFEAFANYEHTHGLPAGFLRRVNSQAPDSNAWARLERGELSLDGFASAFASESEQLGHRVDGYDILPLLNGELRPQMVEAVRRCSARLRTALLTNNFVGLGSTASTDADPTSAPSRGLSANAAFAEVLAMFDVIVESSQIGYRKPDPQFYDYALAAVGVEPDQSVFLDDLGVNLKPARALGINTIKVTDPTVALRELEALVGFPLG